MNMNLCRYVVVGILVVSSGGLIAQQARKPLARPHIQVLIETDAAKHSAMMYAPRTKEIGGDPALAPQWGFRLMPRFSREHGAPDVRAIKDQKESLKILGTGEGKESPVSTDRMPVMGRNFEGNWNDYTSPPDNGMAVSKSGMIISVNNDAMMYFSSKGEFVFGKYWYDFIGNPNYGPQYFDPHVVYDSDADRFIFVVLNGMTPETSTIFLGFSKSSDPRDGWNTYMLEGNILKTNCWFDFPNIGLSNNEVYVTGNLFQGDGSGFQQPIIFQIQKSTGYSGTTLRYIYWYDISTVPYLGFSLVPVSYGHEGSYGPGVYLVSNAAKGDNRIRVFDLTDDLTGSPRLDAYSVNVRDYSPVPSSYQKGSVDRLDNGDCRILSTFFLNGLIHLAFHADIEQGWAGIHYSRISVNDYTSRTSVYGMQGSHDYCYPALVPFSESPTDETVMVGFLRSSKDLFPEFRVALCDHDFAWSQSLLIKGGETFVNFKEETVERWGDYIHGARIHGATPPRVWMVGCYGADTQNRKNTYKAWLAELSASGTSGIDVVALPAILSIHPNPIADFARISFTHFQQDPVHVEIVNALGIPVKLLYHGPALRGDNVLTFNRGALPSGVYRVVIRTEKRLIASQPVVVVR